MITEKMHAWWKWMRSWMGVVCHMDVQGTQEMLDL